MNARLVHVVVPMDIDLALAREQRDYCINEEANARGEPKGDIYAGIVNLYDAIIEAVTYANTSANTSAAIILSDGNNVGGIHNQVQAQAAVAACPNVKVFTVGLTGFMNQAVLESFAAHEMNSAWKKK
jgi:hypothetical protein